MANGSELKPLPEEDLKKEIVSIIKDNKLGVVATSKDNVPRATTLHHELEGTTLVIACGPGLKIENVKSNPKVSVAVRDSAGDPRVVKGIQITGEARIVTDTDGDCVRCWKIFNQPKAGQEGWDVPPKGVNLMAVEMKKVELIDTSLTQQGYDKRHTWVI